MSRSHFDSLRTGSACRFTRRMYFGIEIKDASRLIFVSGQVGTDAEGKTVGGIEAQAGQAVANLNAVLAEADLTGDAITKLTIYLTDPAHIGPFMAAAAGLLPTDPPATTLLIVQGLAAPDLLVEIEAIAAA